MSRVTSHDIVVYTIARLFVDGSVSGRIECEYRASDDNFIMWWEDSVNAARAAAEHTESGVEGVWIVVPRMLSAITKEAA